jgi:hypothetical protein
MDSIWSFSMESLKILSHSWCKKDIAGYTPDMPKQFISIQKTKEQTKITLSTYKLKNRKNLLQFHTNSCRRCTIFIFNTSLILWTNKYNPTRRQWISRFFFHYVCTMNI